MRATFRRPAIVTVALIALVAVPVTLAKHIPLSDHVSISASTSLGPDENGADSSSCPRGFRVASGGFLNHVPDSGQFPQPMVLVNSLRRPDSGTIRVGARNIGDQRGDLYLESYCERPADTVPPMVARARDTSVQRNSASSVTASCPPGKVVSLGGFKSEIGANQNPLVVATGLRRVTDQKWRVTGVNLGSSPGNLTAIAYCANGRAPKEVTSTVRIPPGDEEIAKAKCPPHSRLQFGGYASEHTPDAADILVWHFRRESLSAWGVKASNRGLLAGKLTAIAYCS